MKKFLSVALLSVSLLTLNAQEQDPVLLTVGGNDVELSEFNAIYNKNNSKANHNKNSSSHGSSSTSSSTSFSAVGDDEIE